MRSRRLLALAILLASLVLPARADEVDDYLAKFMADKGIPGLQIGIFENGKIVKAKGYGSTRTENGDPVDEKTLFNIGSVTKQFTATAVMMLVEDGKLSVDDSIRKHLPELPETFEPVLVRHILGHTSGLGDYGSVPGFDFHGQPTEKEFLTGLEQTKLEFAPGEKYRYSNIGYSLLGVLIHRVSGQSYEELVSERLFKKLGMDATRFIQPGPWPGSAAVGYNLVGKEKRPGRIERAKLAAPSGAILTNAPDMAKWDAALRGTTLLKKESLDRMWTSGVLNDGKPTNYGFGWSLRKTETGSFVLHTGATVAGFRAAIVRQLDGPFSAVVFVNLGAELSLPTVLDDVVRIWKNDATAMHGIKLWYQESEPWSPSPSKPSVSEFRPICTRP